MLRLTDFLVCWTACLSLGIAWSQEPLSRRVDQLLAQAQVGSASPVASDEEFFRRLSLDLRGSIPTAQEIREFLNDSSPNKRSTLVDRWMNDPRFHLRWADFLHVTLMERRPDKHVPYAEWIKFLQLSSQQGKRWNQLAREIFTADGTDPNLRPAAKFWLDRDAEPHILTRDIGRIFFGMDLQCAQCHDHPSIEHYVQADYYGLFAFTNRTVLFQDQAQKKAFLGERAEGDADYKSVFTGDASRSRPRLPGGVELVEPHYALGEEYLVPPQDKVRPVPKHSRRAMLVAATDGSNAAFNRNFANRIWALLFGRGLVHPVDLHHPHNPPTAPDVLDLITQELVAADFDHRFLIRELVLTQAYQRAIDPPARETLPAMASVQEQLTNRSQAAAALKPAVETAHQAQAEAYEAVKASLKALEAPDKTYREAYQAAVAARKPVLDAEAAVTNTQSQVSAQEAVVNALAEAAAKAAEAVKLSPNDAELVQAAGVFSNKLQAAQTQLAALQKTLSEQSAALEQSRLKWKEAVAAAETAYQNYQTAAQPWEEAKVKWFAARQESMRLDAQLQAFLQQEKAWLEIAQFGELQAQIAQWEQAVSAAQSAVVAAQNEVAAREAEVAARQTELSGAEQSLMMAAKSLETAQQEHQARLSLSQAVAEAVSKTEAALLKLPGDQELTAALDKLRGRLVPLTEQTQAAETLVKTHAQEHEKAVSQMQAARDRLAAATAPWQAAKQRAEEAVATFQQAQTRLAAARGEVDNTWAELTERWSHRFLSGPLKPLTPEQLAWSMMEACGVVESYRHNAEAEIEKTIPRAEADKDPAQQAQRAFLVAQKVHEMLAGIPATFVGLYGNGAGQTQDQFFATVEQALFVANGGTIRGWLPGLANRLHGMPDVSAAAEELFLSVLSRRPTDAEVAHVQHYLAARDQDRQSAWQELVWALLASAEFRFYH